MIQLRRNHSKILGNKRRIEYEIVRTFLSVIWSSWWGKMRRAGIVTSIRGAAGGYRLAKPPSTISVGDVLRALEGDLEAVNCPGNDEVPACEAAPTCVTKYVWKRINDSISQAVDTIMIEELVQESKKLNGKE